jgi:hypothetical protein
LPKKILRDYSRVISSGGTIFLEPITLGKLSAWCESHQIADGQSDAGIQLMPRLKLLVAAVQANQKLHQQNACQQAAAEVDDHTEQQIGASLLRNETLEQAAMVGRWLSAGRQTLL